MSDLRQAKTVHSLGQGTPGTQNLAMLRRLVFSQHGVLMKQFGENHA